MGRYAMKPGKLFFLFSSAVCLTVVTTLHLIILERSQASVLKADTCIQEEFRLQQLKTDVYEKISTLSVEKGEFGKTLASTMLYGKFMPEKVWTDDTPYIKYKEKEYLFLIDCYEAVWADIVYFPIPSLDISFENSWMAPRDYGGERFHEGTDLFGTIEQSGYYPVVSMTDGEVEQIGWLPLGGYRIGVRSPHGGYFYYAHLSGYEKKFAIGEPVVAGDILGYMGNTGYGIEGTKGKFPVHLHIGIYITTPYEDEMSVNPYWVLRACQKKIRKYTY